MDRLKNVEADCDPPLYFLYESDYITPCSIMAWATFMKPAMLAPLT